MARRKNDPEGARDAIIDAAADLFAEHGFAGTTIADVAKRAGVTKSLIHHHVGNKSDLWKAVKRTMFAKYFEAQRGLIMSRDGDSNVLRQSFETYFEFLRENPRVVRLVSWMNLQQLPQDENDDPSDGLTEFGVQRLLAAQQAGTIRDDVHPFFMLCAFFCLCEHWFQARDDFACRYDTGLEGGRAR